MELYRRLRLTETRNGMVRVVFNEADYLSVDNGPGR